jgi:hypothetical protein
MRHPYTSTLAASLLVLGATSMASAQSGPPVAELLPAMVVETSKIPAAGGTGHTDHFTPDPSQLGALYELNRLIAVQVGSFPMGPATFATTVQGPDGQNYSVSETSAFTVGDGRLSLGIGYQATTFTTADDVDLRSSEINLYLPHRDTGGGVADRDMMRQVVSLRLNRKIASFALTYGVSDRTDFGVVVPFVQVAADARVTSHIVRTATGTDEGVHAFDPIGLANRTLPRYCSNLEAGFNPEALECHGSATARGFGDIVVRGRHRLVDGPGGVAVGVDVMLPTGSRDEFIGLGAFRVRPNVTVSAPTGRFIPRARVDYTWSEGELSPALGGVSRDVPDEIGVGAGFDALFGSRTTLAVDVLARRIDGLPEIGTTTLEFPARPASSYVGVDALSVTGTRAVVQTTAAVGLRVSLPADVTGQMSVLMPVGRVGLQPGPMAVFSLTRGY